MTLLLPVFLGCLTVFLPCFMVLKDLPLHISVKKTVAHLLSALG